MQKSIKFRTKDATIKEEDGSKRLKVPVSSVTEDRDGDQFKQEGLEKMIEQINKEPVPMFPNHGESDQPFSVPYRFQDIMGKWIAGEIKDGTAYAEAELREGLEATEHLEDLIEQDMPVGFSVGFNPNLEKAEEKDNGGYAFVEHDLLEISPVGIPSNPDAVVEFGLNVAKAVKKQDLDVEDAGEKIVKLLEKNEESTNEDGVDEENTESSEGNDSKQEDEEEDDEEEDEEDEEGEDEEENEAEDGEEDEEEDEDEEDEEEDEEMQETINETLKNEIEEIKKSFEELKKDKESLKEKVEELERENKKLKARTRKEDKKGIQKSENKEGQNSENEDIEDQKPDFRGLEDEAIALTKDSEGGE